MLEDACTPKHCFFKGQLWAEILCPILGLWWLGWGRSSAWLSPHLQCWAGAWRWFRSQPAGNIYPAWIIKSLKLTNANHIPHKTISLGIKLEGKVREGTGGVEGGLQIMER